MRDTPITRGAIVLSTWGWKMFAVPERMAMALGRAGWRVLYCEVPRSFVREEGGKRFELAPNVDGYTPQILSWRLNRFRLGHRLQTRLIIRQLLQQTRQMGVDQLVVMYPCLFRPSDMAPELTACGVLTVFLCLDYLPPAWHHEFAGRSDLTLVIPRTMYHVLKARFGPKVCWIPQLGADSSLGGEAGANSEVRARIEQIPRPRLGYLGTARTGRLHAGLVRELLAAHPEWHMITCGGFPNLKLPNLHDIGWIPPEGVAQVNRALDVGFMPYDCSYEMNLHCNPMKLFDYFVDGLPVVSTPIIALWEYGDLVYLGDSATELANGIRQALAEGSEDPRRDERRRIARAHSIDEMSRLLSALLTDEAPNGAPQPARQAGPARG